MAKKGKVGYLPIQALDEIERIMSVDDISVNSEALRKMASYSKIGWEVKKNVKINKEVNNVLNNKKARKKKNMWDDLSKTMEGFF